MERGGRSAWKTARILVQEMEEAEKLGKPEYELQNTAVRGRLDLSNRAVDVAVVFTDFAFVGKVDLRYCEFKQAVKFCNCTFVDEFDSGNGTDARTVYRKYLVCSTGGGNS